MESAHPIARLHWMSGARQPTGGQTSIVHIKCPVLPCMCSVIRCNTDGHLRCAAVDAGLLQNRSHHVSMVVDVRMKYFWGTFEHHMDAFTTRAVLASNRPDDRYQDDHHQGDTLHSISHASLPHNTCQ